MTTTEQARTIALALPEAQEKAHMGHPDFRVRDRIFAGFPKEGQMSVALDAAEQAAALERAPDAIAPAAGAWGRQGWTIVELAQIAPGDLSELVEEAWCGRAPRELADAYVERVRAADPSQS